MTKITFAIKSFGLKLLKSAISNCKNPNFFRPTTSWLLYLSHMRIEISMTSQEVASSSVQYVCARMKVHVSKDMLRFQCFHLFEAIRRQYFQGEIITLRGERFFLQKPGNDFHKWDQQSESQSTTFVATVTCFNCYKISRVMDIVVKYQFLY